MKVFKRIVILFLCLMIATGCGEKIEKIDVEYQNDITAAVEVNASDIQAKRENEESFVLYIYRDTCGACSRFKPVLNEFIYIYQMVIYEVELTLNHSYLTESIKRLEYTPSVVIFSKGEQMKLLSPERRTDTFTSVDGFASTIFKYVNTMQ